MPPEADAIGTPAEWLRHARSNLARANQAKPVEVLWEDLCFDAQQAAEKAIKAVLVERGVEFPKTHDIAELFQVLEQSGIEVADDLWKSHVLTKYAIETRYPGPAPVTEDAYREAVALAEQVVRWAEGIVHGG